MFFSNVHHIRMVMIYVYRFIPIIIETECPSISIFFFFFFTFKNVLIPVFFSDIFVIFIRPADRGIILTNKI